jgi:hypothetical protein
MRVVTPLLAAASVFCLAAVVTASPADSSTVHRKLLKHDINDFRTLAEGGAHNALSPGADIANSVSATTCLPTDDFVRTGGGKFLLGGTRDIKLSTRLSFLSF